MRTTSSMTGTSISTPTTVASAAPELKPNKLMAAATAISLFGLDSGAALATVVGVLVEVPVMLSVVRIVKATRGWYEGSTAELPTALKTGR